MTAKNDMAMFEILLDGNAAGDDIRVVAVQCWHAINRIGWAELQLADSEDKTSKFPTTNNTKLKPGTTLEIKMGRGSASTTVFKGCITGSRLSVGNGEMHLVVEACDNAYKMTLVPTTKVFTEQTDSDIATSLIGAYSDLTATLKSTTVSHDQVLQHQTSDWDFLLTRLSLQSLLVSSCAGTVTSFEGIGAGDTPIEQKLDETLIRFEGHVDSRRQKDSIDILSWDLENQETVSSSATAPSFEDQGSLSATTLAATPSLSNKKIIIGSAGSLESDDATGYANALLLQSRLAKMQCDIDIVGRADIQPGSLLSLSGFGDLYDGKALVSDVEHHLQDGHWQTSIRTGINPDWVMNKLVNTGDIDRFPERLLSQLHLGKVIKISEDPENLTRVQVSLPLVFGDEADPVWARVSSFSAGNNRGGFFMPNVGDEVLVGFVGANNLNPVILGKLFSKNRAAPLTPEDENNYKKGFYSDQNMTLLFDDEKPSLTLSTPGGASITMDDDANSLTLKDQNGNSISLGEDGIKMTSSKDYTVSASSGNIQESGMEVALDASTSTKISGGTTAEVSGGTSTKVSGGTMAEFTCGGITKVQGSMVQIN